MKVFCFFLFLPLVFSSAAFAQSKTPDVAQQMEGFNLVGYSEEGQKSWDIKGDKADIEGNQVDVTNVDANAYGEEDMNLKAKHGTLNRETGDVYLQKDVVITAERGAQMKTDTLEWRRKEDLVTTEDRVVIEDKEITLRGEGMEASPSLKQATLKKDVSADIASPTPENLKNRIQVTSDGPMDMEQGKHRAVFRDNVIAIELSTGRKLKADMMEIRFDPKTRRIDELLCVGNVEMHQGENVTYSEMMVYKATEQRMTLTGRPKILIDPGDTNTSEIFKF